MPPTSRSHKSTKSASKVEEVTDGLSNLKIRSKATTSKAESTAKQEFPADKLRNSMVTINEVSQTLSSAVKSGWKLGSEGDSEWSLGKISKVIELVPGALTTLRTVYKEQGKTEKLVDVERAALGIVSKLNGLRVYTLTLDLLGEIRAGILSLLGVEEIEERPKSRSARSKVSAQPTHLNLLRLPVLPSSTPPQPLQVALATFQAHSIKAVLSTLTHIHLEELHGLLTSPEFSLNRSPPTSGILPTEQLSALYVGTFQALAGSGVLSPPPTPAPTTTTATRSTRAPSATRKASGSSKSAPAAKSGSGPEELALLVRKQALLILARSPSLTKDTDLFWDQALKWGAMYVKSVSASPSPPTESQITQTLSQFFTDLVSGVTVRGPRFEAMCEWWMRFAKKTKDAELIGRISGLLRGNEDEPHTPTRTHTSDTKVPLPETKAIPSETRQTPAALLAILDRASLSTDPGDMNAAADALMVLSRNTPADSSLPQRVSDLRKACAKCWAKDKDASRRVVEAIVICAQVPDFPTELTVSAVDALLTLSRNELNTGDYETYEKASEGVGKAIKLAEAFATRSDAPDQTTHPRLLRAISNTGYTLAGSLYNATRATQAIGFVQQSCLIGEQALALADAHPGTSKDKEIVALRDHMPRRWELLAICRLKSTDRRGAVEAYGKALVWHIALLPSAETEKLDDKVNHLVSQLVAISVGELFDPESVLLSRLFANLDVDEKVVCLMMERVVKVLEDMMHKPIAQKAMELVVEELGRMWGDEHPIKRAKLLISLLKHEYHASGPAVKVSSEEVIELLLTENLKRDAGFKPHVPEYIAQTRIWTALLLHKSNAPTTEVAAQANAACEKLLEMVNPVVESVSAKSAGKKPIGRTRSVSRRRAKDKETAPPKDNKTPAPLVLDDRAGLVQSMDMISQILGLLNHTVLKLQFLHIIIWICEETGVEDSTEVYVKTSIDLSTSYIQLGQTETAMNVLARSNELAEAAGARIGIPALVMLRLLYSDVLARLRRTEESAKIYLAALELSEQIEPAEKGAAYMVKTQARLQALQRSATACGVYASIQLSRDDTTSMLLALTQSLRLWNRAIDILLRLTEKIQPSAPAEPANPLRTIFDLGEAYSLRGSVREAEFFLGQAESLSESLNAPLGVGRSLLRQAELQMTRGLLDEALEALAKAEDIVADPTGVDTSELNCLLGHHRQKEAVSGEDAYTMYTRAQTILDELNERLAGLQRHKSLLKPTTDILAPDIRGVIMREQIWLSQIGEVQTEKQTPLEELGKLPRTLKSTVEDASLLGRIALHEVYSQFRSDLFLSSLTESAIAVPMGMTSKDATSSQPAPTRDALNSLEMAEQNFWKTLQLSVARGDVARIRESATNLARIMAFQSSLGKQGVEGAVLTAALLDYSNATTLRREMLDAIANKDKTAIGSDDMIWLIMNEDGSPCNQPVKKSRELFPSEEAHEKEDLETGGEEMRRYWEFLKTKYSSPSFDASMAQQINLLPKHWTVVTINVTDDKTALIISRQRPDHPPVIFCLPLDRRGREGDDEEQFSYDDAIDEFVSIIETSDRITHEGVNIEGNKQAIAEWWAERTVLDQRMRELLDNIEFCWLGIFKTALATPHIHGSDTLSLLRSRLDKAFKRNGIGSDKASARPKLDKGLLDCFSSISPKCRDEELEDLAYFILDLYQLHGTSIALSDVDIDTLVVDLRNALEEHALKTTPRPIPVEDHHMFLVLDKNAQRIPWESIPVLRGRSVSRIPSISFLVDRIQLARHRQGLSLALPDSKSDAQQIDRIEINPKRVRYVLNPKGDLKHTEKQFGPWLKRMTKEAGWSGTIGRKPTEEEMARSLSGSDLFIYFGHGGGEQFIRSQKIRHLSQCSAAMLWGCSSGAMREMGDFDPIGTPYHYMLAGCPTLVATLWDVTDRECDRFAQSVFTSLKLDDPKKSKTAKTSVVQAVASAREACKLKYLTGAAPVIYGIPFYL
ncbi:peptidase family C50-domain-containing protein [Rhizoctonia solani]|nr:peptidase family C50-domain-containing protein [Rhizoctonia solani]